MEGHHDGRQPREATFLSGNNMPALVAACDWLWLSLRNRLGSHFAWMVMMVRRGVLAGVAIVVLLPSCTPRSASPPSSLASATVGPAITVKIARHLTSAPEGCAGPSPSPTKVARFIGPVVGASPLWGGFYARFDPKANTYRDGELRRTKSGWALKVIWLIEPGMSMPVTLIGTKVSTGEPLSFRTGGLAPVGPTTTLVLDPQHPAIPIQHGSWKEFTSELLFPSSGCYRLHASWTGGGWEIGFGFGR